MAIFNTKTKPKKQSTQAYLDIAAVKDNIVVLKNGGLRTILLASSLNFALKSPQEQEDIVLRYQGFLNSLNFPLQIVMQSRKFDITDYLAKLKKSSETQANEKIREQIEGYVDFMQRLVSVANIMDKRFFIIVPLDPANLKQRSFFEKIFNPVKQVTLTMTEKEFADYSIQIQERVEIIQSGLGSLGIRSAQLNTQQLIELYYASYNPEEAATERMVDIEQLKTRFISSGDGQGNVE